MPNLLRRPLLATLAAWLILIPQAHAFSTVVIDAGHGGKDPGSAWNGLVEKKLCLDVAKRLESALKAKGLHTVMTRTDDNFVELSDRAEIANRHEGAIFVSIHFDASKDTSAHGYTTHYQTQNGKLLADSVQAAMAKSVPGKSRGSSFQDLKVLRETKCVGVLVECGFISNKNESSDCGSWKHRQMLADAIAKGLLEMKAKF